MNTDHKAPKIKFLAIIALLSVLPFLVLGAFTVPSADDIFYHNYGKDKTLLEFSVHHYNTWTGRYFSNLMMAINPYSLTSSEGFYPVMTYLVQIFFFSCAFFFTKTLVLIFKNGLNSFNQKELFKNLNLNLISGFILLIWIALFMHKMPRPTDSLYWFSGSSSHLIAEGFVLLSIATYFKSFALSKLNQINYYLLISVFTVAICGSNETLMIQWIFLMFFSLVFEKIIFNRINLKTLMPLSISLICFMVVYFAPGNKIRAANLHGGHDLLLLASKPWGLIIETSLRYLSLNLIIILFWSLPILKTIHNYLPNFLTERKSKFLFGLFWLGLFVLTFVPSVWTMGGLPPRRVLNNTYFMILFTSFFVVLININSWHFLFTWKNKWDLFFPFKWQKVVFALSFLFLFNNFFAWKDLIFIPKFLASVQERKSIVENPANLDTEIEIPPLSYFPSTFFYEDITTDAQDYRNLVFAEFYKLKSVKLTKPYNSSEVFW